MADAKKKKIRPLGENMGAVVGRQLWGNQLHLFPLVRRWPEIAGKEISRHSMPAYFRRDVLWVYVQSSVWMQQMQLAKLELLEKVNHFLQDSQQVNDLRWMVQPADLIDVVREKFVFPQTNVDPAAEREFRVMAENITDPVIREALCNLWLCLTTKNNIV